MQPSVTSRPPWWLWPTILSLDAPVVVVLWQGLIARSASAASGVPEAVVLGSSIWLAYAADRWIEGWRLAPGTVRTHRHLFYQRARWPVFGVWVAVLGADITLAARGLTARQFEAGAVVLAAVAAYLLSHQLLHRKSRWRAPKEVCVALLLAAGALVFTVSQPAADLRGVIAPTVLFVLLCFSNCALISVWESEVDRSHGQTSVALQMGRSAAVFRYLPWGIAAIAIGVGFAGVPHAREAAICASASGIALGLVNLAEGRSGPVGARVLADVALLTPAAYILLSHG